MDGDILSDGVPDDEILGTVLVLGDDEGILLGLLEGILDSGVGWFDSDGT